MSDPYGQQPPQQWPQQPQQWSPQQQPQPQQPQQWPQSGQPQPPQAPPPPQYYPAPVSFAPQRSDPSTPLDQPYYGIGFLAAWKRYWKKYAVFTGRASRSEFWWADLANGLLGIAIYVLLGVPAIIIGVTASDGDSFPVAAGILLGAFSLVFVAFVISAIVPSFALLWRRLHDANLPGALALLVLFPSLGGIWAIVIGFLPSNPLGARFDERWPGTGGA